MSPNADFSSESTVEGGEIVQRWIPTFFDFLRAGTGSPSKPKAKKARHDGSGSTASEKLDRVSFHLRPLYQFLTCSRIPLTIARASR
jgi:hypothetical protein